MLITIILSGIVVPWVSCGKKTETIPENQLVTVQRGNLTIDITGSGNLAYSDYQDLAFQISGASTQQPLTVGEVLVEAGDSVEEGQVLVKADTLYLEQAVKTAERAVKTSGIALEKATDNWRKITYPYTFRTFQFDVPVAGAFINDAQRELNEAIAVMHELGMSREQYDWRQYWDVWHNLEKAQNDLAKAKENLKIGAGPDLFSGFLDTRFPPSDLQQGGSPPILPVADYWTLKAAQMDMESAQVALDTANDNLNQAQEKLKEAVIVAPFAGFVTIVNVKGGDTVQRGVVAVRLVDPNKFEAVVMVNEMDIFQVKLGGDATVQVNAMPAFNFPAKVTQISPTATITSGVVNYQVKVELQSLQPIQQGQQGQVPTMLPENFQLREGLTATVSIIVEQKSNVLLVPNAAITKQGGKSYVQVMLPTGITEQRAIQTGATDYQYTEVIKGLSEGEKVIVPQRTATTTSTTQPSTIIRIPGMGR